MFVLVRALTYAALFIGLVLIYLPARLLSWSGIVRPAVIDEMWSELESDWPVVRGLRVGYSWACFRPAHPDLLPVIDQLPGLANAWLTSGHYKTGILMAPGTGQAIARWIASGDRPAEVASFGVARFAQAR